MLEDISQLMIRENHRATNNDLAAFVRGVVESEEGKHSPAESGEAAPAAIVVLAVEAFAPPRSLSTPKASLIALTQEWTGIIGEAGGNVWERAEGSLLVCWDEQPLKESLERAVTTSIALRKVTRKAGYRLSAGLAPGVARLHPGTGRPGDGWELAGPFYLARWMMNLSAHRGRPLLTEVGARSVSTRTTVLGRISILGNRYINLYEVG
jgi:hypothetical protein